MTDILRAGAAALHRVPAVATGGAPARRTPILLLHGIFGGAWAFADTQRWLSERGWTSYAIDVRGRGAGAPVPEIGRASVRDYVADAIAGAREVARLHGTAPAVVGHSMGGFLAQKVAEAGEAAAIVLLCSAPPRGIPVIGWELLRRLVKPRYLLPLLFSRALRIEREDVDALILNRVVPGERAAIHARFSPDSGRAGRELALGVVGVDVTRVRCPVLGIATGNDRFVPPRVVTAIARRYGGELRLFAPNAHFPLAEPGADAIREEIDRWLRGACP